MDASKDMFYLLAGGLGFAITLTVSDILNLLDSAILTYLVYSVFFAYLGYLYALWSAPVSKRDDEGVEDEEEEKEVMGARSNLEAYEINQRRLVSFCLQYSQMNNVSCIKHETGCCDCQTNDPILLDLCGINTRMVGIL